MDHTIVAFTVGIVFSVKIWKKTGKLVWTDLFGLDYLTFAKYPFSVFTVLNYRELKSQLFGMNVMKIL